MNIRLISLSLGAAVLGLSAQGFAASPSDNAEAMIEDRTGPPYTSYCIKPHFRKKDGKMYCNWGPSFNHACDIEMPNDLYVHEGAKVEDKKEIGKCADGRKVFRLRHH